MKIYYFFHNQIYHLFIYHLMIQLIQEKYNMLFHFIIFHLIINKSDFNIINPNEKYQIILNQFIHIYHLKLIILILVTYNH